ncbi:MAG: SUMF1/EgtB/PvdO family nonheme iron enzyme [Bacteroidota bacterium]
MKIWFFALVLLCFGFSKKHYKNFVPPGTIKINDTLYCDETEVSNLSWTEFVYWTKTKYGKNSEAYLATLPDKRVWMIDSSKVYFPYASSYFSLAVYKNYPVVGISYEQAQAFCKWRTERVREYMWISKKYPLINFEYRLPSKAEWELLSNNGCGVFNQKNDFTFKYNHQKALVYNINYHANCIFNDTVPKIKEAMPVDVYQKNYFGLKNMIGNVREMVLEKSISKGGGWRDKLEDCRVGKDQHYGMAANDLGFRCVCVIKS